MIKQTDLRIVNETKEFAVANNGTQIQSIELSAVSTSIIKLPSSLDAFYIRNKMNIHSHQKTKLHMYNWSAIYVIYNL